MPQLRHADTSALIAEGNPLDLALVAEAVGLDRVAFDDVGDGFDLDATLAAAHARADAPDTTGLKAADAKALRDRAKAEQDRNDALADQAAAAVAQVLESGDPDPEPVPVSTIVDAE